GSTYNFTDETKVENLHCGAINDDTTTVIVDSNQPHGSQKNPYVIDSILKWTSFANAMNTAPNGQGEYFYLAADLDFTSQTFTPVATFKGTFYGGGHKLENISHNFGSGTYSAVFGAIDENVIICDLDIANATFTGAGHYNAFVCGVSSGGKILNCHANGSISTLVTISGWVASGGILGVSDSEISSIIYRCSANTDITLYNSAQEGSGIGVILGATFNGGQITVLDSYGIMENHLRTNVDIYGGLVGMCYNGGDARIENCVSDIFYKGIEYNGNRSNYHPTSLGSFWMAKQHPDNFTVKNTYTNGRAQYDGVLYKVNPTAYYVSSQASQSSIESTIALDIDNYNWYAEASASYLFNTTLWAPTSIISNANTKLYSGAESDFWTAAKNDSSLPAAIWLNKNEIGSSAYTVDNAPNRNTNIKTEDFKIKYVNLENGAEKEYAGSETTYNYKDTTQLYTPDTKENHEFVGWTTDKTGNGETYKNIPSDLYG
ncbi:MAG: hypothetical protein OSJ74_10750, partial [Clostridia bacterium]|nr:hypothetical protein [Clostridia bacterium]